MRIVDVTQAIACDYLRIPVADVQTNILTMAMTAAEEYIKAHTGMNATEINACEDLTPAYIALIVDFYDNRGVVSDGKSANKTVESILALHARNLI